MGAHGHESNKNRIWIVLGILSLITAVEVGLGIAKPDFLHLHGPGISWLNWIFIILTLVKAYYIAWAFMHLEGEKKWFRRSVTWVGIFLVSYMIVLFLTEGGYIHSVMSGLNK